MIIKYVKIMLSLNDVSIQCKYQNHLKQCKKLLQITYNLNNSNAYIKWLPVFKPQKAQKHDKFKDKEISNSM